MQNLNLLQNGMLQTVKQQKINTIKAVLSNLRQKILSLCDYSDAFILVTGDITVVANDDTDVAFKKCAPFPTCKTVINDVFIDEASHIYIAMSMCNLIEYSDNFQTHQEVYDSLKEMKFLLIMLILLLLVLNLLNTKQLLQEKQQVMIMEKNTVKDTNIVVPLKYLSNF